MSRAEKEEKKERITDIRHPGRSLFISFRSVSEEGKKKKKKKKGEKKKISEKGGREETPPLALSPSSP